MPDDDLRPAERAFVERIIADVRALPADATPSGTRADASPERALFDHVVAEVWALPGDDRVPPPSDFAALGQLGGTPATKEGGRNGPLLR